MPIRSNTVSGNLGSYSSTPTCPSDDDFTGEIIASTEDIGDAVRGLTDADSDDRLLSPGQGDLDGERDRCFSLSAEGDRPLGV